MDVFVSYASTDRDRIAPLVQALEGGGWSVWWDRHLEAGTAFDREIQHALDESKCVIVVWTEASVESDWVLAEAGDGLERGILIPVMLDDVRPPLAFRRTHAIQREDVIEAVARLLTGAKTAKNLCVLSVHFVNLKDFDADLQRVKRIAGMFRGRMNEPEDGSIQIQFPSVVGSTRAALEMRKVMGSAVRLGIRSHRGSRPARGWRSPAAPGSPGS